MKKKKILNLDSKKRVTLGKLIPRETTYFEVEKQKDGSIILIPKTNITELEISIYKNKTLYKTLKKGLKDIKKGLVTPLGQDFWEGI